MGYQISNIKYQNSKLKTQNSKLKTQISNIKYQNSKLKTQSSKLKAQNSKLKTQNSKLKYQISNIKYQISNLKSQISTAKSYLRATSPPPSRENKLMKTVNKREHKLSICTDRRFLKIHEKKSVILPKTTCTLRTLYLFVFVHFICSCSCTRPWLVKCTTFFWLRTLNKFVNILDFAGFGRPPVYSAVF